ncbi:MAG: hypothetical protein ACTJH7_10220 [Alcaligenes sp.]
MKLTEGWTIQAKTSLAAVWRRFVLGLKDQEHSVSLLIDDSECGYSPAGVDLSRVWRVD